MPAPNRAILEVRPAKDNEVELDAFIQLLASLKSAISTSFFDRLLNKEETITLELASLNQTTFFIITVPQELEVLVRSQITAHYPSAVIASRQDYLPSWLEYGKPQLKQLTLSSPAYLPIKTTDKNSDPLASILGVLSKLPASSSAIIQFVLSAPPKGWDNQAKKLLNPATPETGPKEHHPQKRLIEEKLSFSAFALDIHLAALTPTQEESKNLLTLLSTSFGSFAHPEGNSLVGKNLSSSSQDKLKKAILSRSSRFTPSGQVLNLAEIGSLFHFPDKKLENLKNIAWGKSLKGEPPENLPVPTNLDEQAKKQVNFFARTEYKNEMSSFGIKRGEDRRRHMYVLGKSGTGKTTLIANMAIADIRNGEGAIVVDPHGDLSEILLNYIPKDRINDVAYLDPSTKDASFHLNPLYVANPAHKDLIASGIVSVFYKLYGNSWGPRLEYVLRNTILTLVSKPGSTLMDVPKLLTNKKYRDTFVDSLADPVLVNFWKDEYDKYSQSFQSEAISPILNKVGQFITSPLIRSIIGHQKSTIDLEDCMNSGKVIILNLAQGKIGEDSAALLGAMFISQIQVAAMNRAHQKEEDRRDVFLYVDEFQNFATTSFIKILSEARKFRLNLVLANQYTAQLPEDIQKAIFGNAGTIISFVVGADDANRLNRELGNYYTQDDLVGLEKYQIITKLSIDGTISTPFPAYTLPLPAASNNNYQKVVESSRQRFYKTNATP